MIAPALVTLAGTLIWTGEFDEGERWLRRTERALQTDTGPGIRLLLHHDGRACCTPAAAGTTRRSRSSARPNTCRSQLEGSHALASQVTGWLLATQARLGMPGEARAALAALDDERPARARSVMPAR